MKKIFPKTCNWACTLKNPCCGGWKISWGRLLLISILLGWNWGKWGLKKYKWQGSFLLVGSLGSMCRYKRFLSSLGCSSRLSTKKNFPPYTISVHLSLTQAAQAVVPGRLSPNVCLCRLWPSRPVRNGLRSLLISNLSQSSHSFFLCLSYFSAGNVVLFSPLQFISFPLYIIIPDIIILLGNI